MNMKYIKACLYVTLSLFFFFSFIIGKSYAFINENFYGEYQVLGPVSVEYGTFGVKVKHYGNTKWTEAAINSNTNVEQLWIQPLSSTNVAIHFVREGNVSGYSRIISNLNASVSVSSWSTWSTRNTGNHIMDYLSDEIFFQVGDQDIYYSGENNVSSPVGLSQSFQSPDPLGTGAVGEENLEHGASVGKFQSGSGIILRASTLDSNPENLDFVVELYQSGALFDTLTSSFNASGSGEVIVPLGEGKYSWSARVIERNNPANVSDIVDFGDNVVEEVDFAVFEGVEPFPFGFNFENNSPDPSILDGGITNIIFDLGKYEKIDGTKWDIFYSAFDTSELENDNRKLLRTFEYLGLNKENPSVLDVGSCYGLSLASTMTHKYPQYLENHYNAIPTALGTEGSIYENINFTPIYNRDGKWNSNDAPQAGNIGVLESIAGLQLSQKSSLSQNLLDNGGITDLGDILTELKNNPNKNYLLALNMKTSSGWGGHAVVPYRVEQNKIYIWDSIYPHVNSEGNENAYNQYIEIDFSNGGSWTNPEYSGVINFGKITLIPVEDFYNNGNKSKPMGLNALDRLFSFGGKGDIIITDSQGRTSGFIDGEILEEIPGANVILPLYNTFDNIHKNEWKQIYLPIDQTDLTIQVIGQEQEQYDLMIAGGDYYTKLEGVSTNSGQIDTFTTSRTDLEIDFDDSKTGNYNLLIDNFYQSGTGTVYIHEKEAINIPQKYSVDWEKVVENTDDAVVYETDTNNDGTYDTQEELPPIEAPETLGHISGNVYKDTNKNGVFDEGEKTKQKWKVYIDLNNDGKLQKDTEPFYKTGKDGYYEFTDLEPGTYIIRAKKKRKKVFTPVEGFYEIELEPGEIVTDMDFGKVRKKKSCKWKKKMKKWKCW